MAFEPIVIDMHELTITPVFRHESIEDVNASEREGTLQKKIRTIVEVRFAGTDRYIPVFPVEAHWKFQNGRSITYAERWGDQYRNFLTGGEQKAAGTPLEMLRPYGITESHLSLCRALKIYSIEALNAVEGDAANGLQMARNDLKKMAKDFLADRANRNAPADEVQALREEVERLRLQLAAPSDGKSDTVVTEPVPDQAALEQAQREANAASAANNNFEAMNDDQLRAFIEEKSGAKPHHRLGRESLINAAKELAA
jgi:hypothetical protein